MCVCVCVCKVFKKIVIIWDVQGVSEKKIVTLNDLTNL